MMAGITTTQSLQKGVVIRSRSRVQRTTDRRGTATLEVALSLPLLLAFMVAIIWLGASMIAQSQVIVAARQQAWDRRNETPGRGLLFMKDDFVSESSTETIDVGPMFENFESPGSSHDVMVGSWNHKTLPLDRVPNWKQYVIAGVNAKTGGLQRSANKFIEWKSLAANAWKTLATDAMKQLKGLGDSIDSAIDRGEQDYEADSSKRNELVQQIREKRSEVSSAEERLKELKEDDEASTDLIRVYENRVKRLKADLEILLADQKAIES